MTCTDRKLKAKKSLTRGRRPHVTPRWRSDTLNKDEPRAASAPLKGPLQIAQAKAFPQFWSACASLAVTTRVRERVKIGHALGRAAK
jgi:hypothetical protein